MSRSRYHFEEFDKPHFLTCTVVEWLPVFSRQETVEVLFDSWRYLQYNQGFQLYGFVVLENHLHVVAQADNLLGSWSNFKSYTARRIIDMLKKRNVEIFLKRMCLTNKASRVDREYQFWQEGSHPQVIASEDVLRQKLIYIHQNPVKRGSVNEPEDWRWSSARNYAGRKGLVEVFTAWWV